MKSRASNTSGSFPTSSHSRHHGADAFHPEHPHHLALMHQSSGPVAALLVLSGGLGEKGVLSPLHIFRRHIFFMRGDAPLLAKRIGNLSVAVAPEHVLYGHIDSRARFHGTVKERVRVWHIHVDVHWVADALAGSRPRRLAHRVIDEKLRIADLHFGVQD